MGDAGPGPMARPLLFRIVLPVRHQGFHVLHRVHTLHAGDNAPHVSRETNAAPPRTP